MTILEFLQAIDGTGQLWAANGQFLGLLSSNANDPNSIINPYGLYGSQTSLTSIRNPSCSYSGIAGICSPYNPISIYPPSIVYQNQAVLVVTRNQTLITNGLEVVDPDLVVGIYEAIAITRKPIDIVALQLQNLADSRAITAQTLSNIYSQGTTAH